MNSISNEGLLETVSKIIKKIYDTVVKMLSGVKKFILGTLKKLTNKISRLTSDDHKLVLDELNKINIDEVSLENKKVTRYTDEDKSIATSIISYFAKKIINGNTDERRVLANIIIANRLNEENPNEITKFTDIITGIYADIKSGKELNKVVDVDLISAIKFRFEYKQAIKEVGYVNGESSDQPGIDSVVVNTLNLHKYGKTGPAGIALSEVITGGSGTNMTVKYCFERIVEMFKKSASNNFRGILNISSVLEKSIDRLEKISKNDLSNLEKDYQKQNLDISVIRTYGQALNDITRMFKALVRAISLYQYSYLEYYKSVKQTNQSIDGIDQKFQQEMIDHSQESYIKGSYLSYYKNINSVYDYVPPPIKLSQCINRGINF